MVYEYKGDGRRKGEGGERHSLEERERERWGEEGVPVSDSYLVVLFVNPSCVLGFCRSSEIGQGFGKL